MDRKNEIKSKNKERGISVQGENCVSVCTREAVFKVDLNFTRRISSIFWRNVSNKYDIATIVSISVVDQEPSVFRNFYTIMLPWKDTRLTYKMARANFIRHKLPQRSVSR